MILTEKIEIIISHNNKKTYLEKGYVITSNNILIDIKDLSQYSTVIITAECDLCKSINKLQYRTYLENYKKFNLYTCKEKECRKIKMKMSIMEKYGVEYISQVDFVKEKVKKTNLERYGETSPMKNIDVKNKKTKTNLERYGGASPMCDINIKNKTINTILSRYGVKSTFESEEIKEKIKNTNLERYGFEYSSQNLDVRAKAKKTNLERYGVENVFQNADIKDIIKINNLEKYGVEYISQNLDVRAKAKKTNLERYGVENVSQNTKIFNKQQQSGFLLKKFNNFSYRGTYELDFIKFCMLNNIEFENATFKIQYSENSINRIYYPDFYIKYLNLVIEIKSNYTFNKYFNKNILKQEATIKVGYNFLFIIDKNYDELLKIIKNI